VSRLLIGVCRTVSQGQYVSFSLQIGRSKECPRWAKVSLISLDKSIRPRNSLVRTDQSPFTAGIDRQFKSVYVGLVFGPLKLSDSLRYVYRYSLTCQIYHFCLFSCSFSFTVWPALWQPAKLTLRIFRLR